jgi:hypothetical protein
MKVKNPEPGRYCPDSPPEGKRGICPVCGVPYKPPVKEEGDGKE